MQIFSQMLSSSLPDWFMTLFEVSMAAVCIILPFACVAVLVFALKEIFD